MRSLAIWHTSTIHHGVSLVIELSGGFAFPSCPGVSSRHDAMLMLLLRPCHVYSLCPGERGSVLTRGIARTLEPFRRRVTMKKSKRNKAQKRQQALQRRRQQHASTRRPVTQIPPESADQVAMTTTGEILQLIRLHYEVEDSDTTARPLRLVALSGIRCQPDAVGLAVYGGSQDLIVQRPACCRQRGLRGICLQRADGTSCSTSAPLNAPPTRWSSLTTTFPGRSRVSPR